jgi:hypothetical protein
MLRWPTRNNISQLRIWKLSGSWYQVFCEQEEYRSSGVQEFRRILDKLEIGATSQAYSWVTIPHSQ